MASRKIIIPLSLSKDEPSVDQHAKPMKQKILATIILSICILLLPGCGDTIVPPSQLPEAITSFVKEHFPEESITYAVKDRKIYGTKYHIELVNGAKIEFDTDNVWDKIYCQNQPVPSTAVPMAITAYTQKNYPSIAIIMIDKEDHGYEVELITGINLRFNEHGAIINKDIKR